ncbi:MAG: 5-formyltetrahydrofolate cyclo-ligase [bacterium]|nr:5-formyltetrahydrofolate cyclo-ligase [bacterium]
MTLEAEKDQVRTAVSAARRSITESQASVAAREIALAVAASAEFQQAERVVFYAATQHEIPTRPLFERARAAGTPCLFPRCAGAGLEFVPADNLEQLQPGRFGILEPEPSGQAVLLSVRDLVLVPGVAFDRAGARLGRGGGFYDRAFPEQSQLRPLLMGFAYSVQLIERVPTAPHDRRMDAVATELGISRPG